MMNLFQKFMKEWRGEDYDPNAPLPQYIEIPTIEFIGIMRKLETNKASSDFQASIAMINPSCKYCGTRSIYHSPNCPMYMSYP
jgi:hypothetical protein